MALDSRFHSSHQIDKAALAAITQAFEAKLAEEDHGVSAEDVAHAKSVGYWQDDEFLTHDESIERCLAARAAVDPKQMVIAFVHGLAQNRPDWWSALPSFGYTRHLKAHEGISVAEDCVCQTCGLIVKPGETDAWDFNSNLVNIIAGGSTPDIVSATTALQFATSFPTFPDLSAEDTKALKALVALLGDLPPKCTAPQLAKLMKGVCGKTTEQRLNIVEGLSVLGILAPKPSNTTTYFDRFVPFEETQVGSVRSDTQYPAIIWRSDHGVNASALDFWFGSYLA